MKADFVKSFSVQDAAPAASPDASAALVWIDEGTPIYKDGRAVGVRVQIVDGVIPEHLRGRVDEVEAKPAALSLASVDDDLPDLDAGAASLDPAVADAIAADLEATIAAAQEEADAAAVADLGGPLLEHGSINKMTRISPRDGGKSFRFSQQIQVSCRSIKSAKRSKTAAGSAVSRGEMRTKETHKRKKTDAGIAGVLAAAKFDTFKATIANGAGDTECVPGVSGGVEDMAIRSVIAWAEANGLRVGHRTNAGGKFYAASIPFTFGGEKEEAASLSIASNQRRMPALLIRGGRGLCEVLTPSALQAFDLRASRVDVAIDFAGSPRLYNAITKAVAEFAAESRGRNGALPTREEGDIDGGRTFYVGTRESPVLLRIYEKGKQLQGEATRGAAKAAGTKAAKAAAAEGVAEAFDPHWVRVEFQFNEIEGHKKKALAKAGPGDWIRAFRWPRLVLARIVAAVGITDGVADIEPISIAAPPRIKSDETAHIHSLKQFGPTHLRMFISRAAEKVGGIANLQITPREAAMGAAQIYGEGLLESGQAERIVNLSRAGVVESVEDRAAAFAALHQAAAEAKMWKRLAAIETIARNTAEASQDEEAKEVTAAATEAAAAKVEAYQTDAAMAEAEAAIIRARKAGPAEPEPERQPEPEPEPEPRRFEPYTENGITRMRRVA